MKAALLLSLPCLVYSESSNSTPSSVDIALFASFKATYSRAYTSPAEEARRFDAFQQNVKQASPHLTIAHQVIDESFFYMRFSIYWIAKHVVILTSEFY